MSGWTQSRASSSSDGQVVVQVSKGEWVSPPSSANTIVCDRLSPGQSFQVQMVDLGEGKHGEPLITFAECTLPYDRFSSGSAECSGVGHLGLGDIKDNTSRMRFELR